MLDSETKRHIDAARQVLVGVVPNPTSQVEQITNALLYKFMDDMDQAAVKVGGKPSFFTDDLEHYAWARIMRPGVGNQERMNLYSEALTKFSRAKQLPPLFREIFADAFLPHRSPETLGLFLKEIDYFDYSHPEELGNAYEYLLLIMASQGDAGQFRTPRNIIDFIVDVVNPTKDDKILDPACGTGGFLVSSYRRILEQHDGKNDPEKKEKPLTPDERKRLMNNLEGYDIDPGMARIARVNMYLHQFKNPRIHRYDTLSSDERWRDKFSVIMANPPFMSPKGGIRPHSKFSIKSSRSEVLFVDYIMDHLRPNGRAGIIVPEGIIFQSSTAYKELRKKLVEDGLYAVVSLPGGVFQPYSGVKTSILLFNNEVAKQRDEILFVKVENDGFALGATRQPISKNDLPVALDILNGWQTGEKSNSKLALYVEKTKIADSGDYNLTGDRYREMADYSNVKWPSFTLMELEESGDITLGRGQVISKKDLVADPGIYPVYSSSAQGKGEFGQYGKFMFNEELISWSVDGGGRFFYRPKHKFSVTNVSGWLRVNSPQKINARYLYRVLDAEWQLKSFDYVAKAHPSVIREIYKIPLPPLDVQEQIVAEIDQHQKVIDGAKQVVQNWKPSFHIDPKWPMVELGDICELVRGVTYSKSYEIEDNGLKILRANNINLDGTLNFKDVKNISLDLDLKDNKKLKKGDIFICLASGSKSHIGKVAYIEKDTEYYFGGFMGAVRLTKKEIAIPQYIYQQLKSSKFNDFLRTEISGVNINNLSSKILAKYRVPLLSLNFQSQIVAEIELEQRAIDECKTLIGTMENKIKTKIAEVWGEEA